jgi:hypothetical protein
MIIKISTHKDNQHVCTIQIDRACSEEQIAEIANTSGGMSDLCDMGENDLPDNYEWTGDEIYEVVRAAAL